MHRLILENYLHHKLSFTKIQVREEDGGEAGRFAKE